MLVVAILVSGLLLYLVFFVLDKYLITFFNKKRVYNRFYRVFSKVQLLGWFVWFVISVYFLILSSPIITLIFLIGIYLFTKDFWKNIYAGIFYINKLKEGDYIYISKLEIGGIIKKLLISDIKLQNSKKELIYVPYSLLTNSPLIRKEKSSNHYINEFTLSIGELNIPLDDKKIKEVIINCPWTIISKPIDIDFIDTDKVRITVYTFSKDTAVKQKEFIISEFSK